MKQRLRKLLHFAGKTADFIKISVVLTGLIIVSTPFIDQAISEKLMRDNPEQYWQCEWCDTVNPIDRDTCRLSGCRCKK